MARKGVNPLVIPLLVAAALTGAFVTGKYYKIPSYVWETEGIPVPADAVTQTLKVRGLKCRHGSEGMYDLLFGRTDANAVKGYLKALVYNDPRAGDLVVTYDPALTNPGLIAKAVKYDRNGQETSAYRVLLDVNPDLSNPAALLRTVGVALADGHEKLFRACHVEGALESLDFAALAGAYGDLFLDGLVPAGAPDAAGKVEVQGLSGGAPQSFSELGITFPPVTLVKLGKRWRIRKADWSALQAGGNVDEPLFGK